MNRAKIVEVYEVFDDKPGTENDRLRATIAELVAVLEKVESAISSDALVAQPGYSDDLTALKLIRDAIAKAKGEI